MLETIQKLEIELAEKIAAAKHEAATALQSARAVAADSRAVLDERLREEEKQALSAAETAAAKEAEVIIAAAEKAVRAPQPEVVKRIASTHLTSLIS